jgi:UMF1 family MFS transporter
LYAVTDKGSSAIGPALTGLIISLTGSIRLAFMLVVVMFVCAILVIRNLDLTRGKLEAEEAGTISPVRLVEETEEEEEAVGPVPDELRAKEDGD